MKTNFLLPAILILSLAFSISSMSYAGDFSSVDPNLPEDFPEFVIIQEGQTAPGYLVGSVSSQVEDVGSYNLVLDNSGYPIAYSKTQSYGGLVINGLLASRTEIPGMKKKYEWFLRDESSDFEDVFQMKNGYLADNHDFQLLPNGHALMLCYDSRTIDMSKIVEGGQPNAQIQGSVIQELDVYKNVVFQWRSWDYIPITDSYQDLTKNKFDYIHVNSMDFDPSDGNIILSCRETSEVIKISRATGDIIWRMGGKHNEFTFINEHEENAPRYFKLQHDARIHPSGTLTMFDNGADKKDMSRPYSRGVEYMLDEPNRTATLVWEFRHDPNIIALAGGNVTRLENGNTTIRWGQASQLGEAPAMTEVDPNGQLVYEIWPAQEGVTGGFSRSVWPYSDLATTVTRYELMEGNTYTFDNGNNDITGVSIKVNSYDGDGYNQVYVTREPFAPLYPEFPGTAPIVLPVRVTVSQYAIMSINADISFDVNSFEFTDPNSLTIYYRPYKGTGLFVPLPTLYNYVTGILRATVYAQTGYNEDIGEFIFCYPDIEQVANSPILLEPGYQQMVNQELPVSFSWTPRGFVNNYHLQIASDSSFETTLVDDANLVESLYTIENMEPNTAYFWRVSTINNAGESLWSESSFQTVSPFVEVTEPNDGEQWHVGLEYYIKWQDNLDEDVVIELYKGDEFVEQIADAPSTGAYLWEVDLGLVAGDDYRIKIKSSTDEAISDTSDNFSIIN